VVVSLEIFEKVEFILIRVVLFLGPSRWNEVTFLLELRFSLLQGLVSKEPQNAHL